MEEEEKKPNLPEVVAIHCGRADSMLMVEIQARLILEDKTERMAQVGTCDPRRKAILGLWGIDEKGGPKIEMSGGNSTMKGKFADFKKPLLLLHKCEETEPFTPGTEGGPRCARYEVAGVIRKKATFTQRPEVRVPADAIPIGLRDQNDAEQAKKKQKT